MGAKKKLYVWKQFLASLAVTGGILATLGLGAALPASTRDIDHKVNVVLTMLYLGEPGAGCSAAA